MNLSAKLLSPSLPIVIPALLLLAAGLASIWEAAPVVLPGTGGFHAVASVALRSFFGKQCVAAGIGILLATLVSRVRPQRLRAAGYSARAVRWPARRAWPTSWRRF